MHEAWRSGCAEGKKELGVFVFSLASVLDGGQQGKVTKQEQKKLNHSSLAFFWRPEKKRICHRSAFRFCPLLCISFGG
jgi:hypothetical protein